MTLGIGCGAAIIKDKKILLTKRVSTKKNYPNHWTFPAGQLEDTDTNIEQAAIREVKEEVNLNFIPTQKLGFYENNSNNTRFIAFVFLGEWTGELKALASEVAELAWFTYTETKNLPIAFAYNQALDDLYRMNLLD